MITTIFGDEAGYTGNDLLNPDQQYFCYCTIAVDEGRAEAIVQEIREKFNIQPNMLELKGSTIVKRKDSVQILEYILSEIDGSFLLTYAHKIYVICCELFEYIFEPVFSHSSAYLYGNLFHLFTSNLLFMLYKTKDSEAIELVNDISNYLRWGNISELQILFKQERIETAKTPIKEILEFALKHKMKILDEFKFGNQESINVPAWTLDLSVTCVHQMLARWGERNNEIKFIYDESKALETEYAKSVFQSMVQRKGPAVTVTLGQRPSPITYKLSEIPVKQTSVSCKGIQLADMLSSFFYHTLSNESEKGKAIARCFEKYPGRVISIQPNLLTVYLNLGLPCINSCLFQELCKLSIKEALNPFTIPDLYCEMFDNIIMRPPPGLLEKEYTSIEEIFSEMF